MGAPDVEDKALRGRARGILVNVGLLLCSLAVIILTTEATFRALAYLDDMKLLQNALDWKGSMLPPGKEVPLGPMIRYSRHEKIIYEFTPLLSVSYAGAPTTINSNGFRDREYPVTKGKGTVRIIGLGDSLMFGQGVPDGTEYLSILEANLNARHPEKKWEVINTAVPGYNAAMELEVLKKKALPYSPDMVVVGFCGNDLSLPNFIKTQEDYFTTAKSFFIEFARSRLKAVSNRVRVDLVEPPRRDLEGDRWTFEDRPDRVPPMYRDMVGWDSYRNVMTELRDLSAEGRFSVFMIYLEPEHPEISMKAMELAESLGFYVVDVAPALRRYMAENGIKKYEGSRLTKSAEDNHPSMIGHRIAAAELLRAIESRAVQEGPPGGF